MKRQSTTAKITKTTVQAIAQDVRNGNGVIVRYKGQEVGIVDVLQRGNTASLWLAVLFGGGVVRLSECTIRKATLPFLPMIGESASQCEAEGNVLRHHAGLIEEPVDMLQECFGSEWGSFT